MLRFYGLSAQYPLLSTIGEILYYGTILAAIVIFAIMVARKLLALGYPKKRVLIFTILAMAVSFPLGYYGSRAWGMFYLPIYDWSFQLLLQNLLHGRSHTFHASLLLPLLAGIIFCRILKLKVLEVFDTIYLYIPLAHALGRLSCLFIGCCWGKYVSFHLFGIHFSFYNPVPLYAIIVNICIFIFLRRVYLNVYHHSRTRELYNGAVFASYFLLYGAFRFTMEVFRTERKIFFGFTNAQITMILFMAAGTLLFLYIYRRMAQEKPSPYPYYAKENRKDGDLKTLIPLAGMLAVLLVSSVLVIHLTRTMHLWQWPFQPVHSLAEAYGRILYYAPVMLIPLFSLYWLKLWNIPFRERFQWGRFSWLFVAVLALSGWYAVDLLFLRELNLRGPAFWPPVVIMSVMNAFSEEIMYRLALYELLRRASYSRFTSNLVQSIAYSLIHFMIAGPVLGIFSLLFGFLLGMVRQRTGSIMPAVVCHFIIDLGAIGMPLLRH